jgi:hypothetical protein
MVENIRKQINYTIACVNEFARKKSIPPQKAFFYLHKYKGIAFIREHYEIEHTLSLDDAIEDMEIICQNNGGEAL